LHADVFAVFDRVCANRGAGGDVLEVGAVPSGESLLSLPALAGASSRVGVNLDGPHRFQHFEILRADANALSCFQDESFDTVVCNAVLEHDPQFWKAIAEMRRVTRPGGLIVIGVPGFTTLPAERHASRIARLSRRLGLRGWLADAADASTLTLRIHAFPSDYYRFTADAMREVLLDGLLAIDVQTILCPPRIVGAGIKPGRAEPRR
jgi:SAM-dependent methyltransferase